MAVGPHHRFAKRRTCPVSVGLLALVLLPAAGCLEARRSSEPIRTLLQGSWTMREVDGSQTVVTFTDSTVAFLTDGRETLSAPHRLIEAPNSVYRLYLSAGREYQPIALVRVTEDRLNLCMVDAYQRTLGGVTLGGVSRLAWPPSADDPSCNVLQRVPNPLGDSTRPPP